MKKIGVRAQSTISATDAANFIGKEATVCGTVASATFSSRTRGQPFFLNLDQPYPRRIFTVVIWGKGRGWFGSSPEIAYRAKKMCAPAMREELPTTETERESSKNLTMGIPVMI